MRPIDRSALHGGGVELRASWGRLFPAAFLIVWLTGWAVGEIAVAGMLAAFAAEALGIALPETVRLIQVDGGFPWPVAAFLVVWLAFWTAGGIAAGRYFWSLLVARERVWVGPGRLLVERRRGPLRQTIEWEIARITRVDSSSGVNVEVDGVLQPVVVTGSPQEQTALAEALRAALGRR